MMFALISQLTTLVRPRLPEIRFWGRPLLSCLVTPLNTLIDNSHCTMNFYNDMLLLSAKYEALACLSEYQVKSLNKSTK